MVCLAPQCRALGLLDRFKSGDQGAAAEFVEMFEPPLRRRLAAMMSPMLARRVEVDDILQSAFQNFFAAAARGSARFETDRDVWRFLLVVGMNRLRAEAAFHRAACRDVRNSRGLEDARHMPPRRGAVGDGTEGLLLRLAIREALEAMDPVARTAAELRMQGHPVETIAEITGRPKRTVERSLQAARRRLSPLLQN